MKRLALAVAILTIGAAGCGGSKGPNNPSSIKVFTVQLSSQNENPPIANVMAASWNAGILPVATVNTDKRDHIRIAVSPISVAVRGFMGEILSSWPGLSRP